MMLKIQAKQLVTKPGKALAGFLKIMRPPDQEVLENVEIKTVILEIYKEAFRYGSEGITHEISKLLVRDWNFKLR